MSHLPLPRVEAPVHQFVSMRFGLPNAVHFNSDQERWAYARDCQRLRDAMPAGECRVAPRVGVTGLRGRSIEAGALVNAADLGENEVGRARLESLILQGYILRSERQSAEELESIAAHVRHVRTLNEAFIASAKEGK